MSVRDTMNVLNEAAQRYPAAISFLAGRPPQDSVSAERAVQWLQTFIAHGAPDSQRRWNELGQYSDTNGIVLEHVVRYLHRLGFAGARTDECILTNGAQEALTIALAGLCESSNVAFAPEPSYVGFTGAAEALGVPVETAPDDETFVTELAARLRRPGPRIGCVYVVPDFANPSTRVMPLEERAQLLALAHEHDFFIIEDAAYRRFAYDCDPPPAIKQLDRHGRVLYVESFAKTVLPGLRLAVMYADHRDAGGSTLASRLSWIKSYLSVATSPLNQAMLAGLLIQEGFVLDAFVAPRRAVVRQNRDAMLGALEQHFSPIAADGVRWNAPEGGFFLTMSLPFEFGEPEFAACAADYGVLVMPMQAFSVSGGYRDRIRLAFSNVGAASIDEGIRRLARFTEDAIARSRLAAAIA